MLDVKTLFFIINKGLQGSVCGQEFLDIILMAAAFDQKVVVLFEGDGVNALLKNQQPECLNLKNMMPVLDTLPVYDINDVIVEIQKKKITSSSQFSDLVNKIIDKGAQTLYLAIYNSNNQRSYITVKLK